MTPLRQLSWTVEEESIVRGLCHALSNRVAALGMAGESLEDDEAEVRVEASSSVRREVDRIAEVTRLLKLLPREGLGRPQALQLSEVLSDAVALQGHHLELRDVALGTTVSTSALPVRVERWALLRTLVLLISCARRGVRTRGDAASVTLHVEGNEQESWVETDAGSEDLPEELEALAAAMEGRLDREGTRLRLVLRSLLALRQREAREG